MNTQLLFEVSGPSILTRNHNKAILNFYLKNSGLTDIYVNARFAVAPVGEIRFHLTLEGQEVPFHLLVRLGVVRNTDFLLLPPGYSVIGGYELTKGYTLSSPGSCTIVGEYANAHVPAELPSDKVFVGQIRSRAFELLVQ